MNSTKQAEITGGKNKSVSEKANPFGFVLPVLAHLSLAGPPVLPFPESLSPSSNPGLITLAGLTNHPATNDSLFFSALPLLNTL